MEGCLCVEKKPLRRRGSEGEGITLLQRSKTTERATEPSSSAQAAHTKRASATSGRLQRGRYDSASPSRTFRRAFHGSMRTAQINATFGKVAKGLTRLGVTFPNVPALAQHSRCCVGGFIAGRTGRRQKYCCFMIRTIGIVLLRPFKEEQPHSPHVIQRRIGALSLVIRQLDRAEESRPCRAASVVASPSAEILRHDEASWCLQTPFRCASG